MNEGIGRKTETIPASKVRSAITDVLLAFPEKNEKGASPIREEMRQLLEIRTTDRPTFEKTLAAKDAEVQRVVPVAAAKLTQYLMSTAQPDWNYLDASKETKTNMTAPNASRVRIMKKVLEPELAVEGTVVLDNCMRALETVLALSSEEMRGKIKAAMTEKRIPQLSPSTFEQHLRFLNEQFPELGALVHKNIGTVVQNEALFSKFLPEIKAQNPTIFENILIDIKNGDASALRMHLTAGIESLVLGEVGVARKRLNDVAERELMLQIDPRSKARIPDINKEIDGWETMINATGTLISVTGKYEPTNRLSLKV